MSGSHTRKVWQYPTDPITRLGWRTQVDRPLNAWMVIAGLALGGWFVDSLLVGLRMHGLPDDNFRVHLWHLWYGPPLLVVGLLLIRCYRPELMQRVATSPVFDVVARNLPPKVKALAFHLARSETQAVLLAFLQQHPTLSLTASDLAGTVRGELDDVELALRQMETLNLVERQYACDLTFYRLTQDEERRQQLQEISAWQENWYQQAQRLMQVVGRSRSASNISDGS